jgi:hypothetical protein
MIDDMGTNHVLQTTSNPLVSAPRIRRSKNGFRASMALCLRVPGSHIAKSCSGSLHRARPTMRIRARRKRLQRLSRHSGTSDCFERLAKKKRLDPEQCSNFIEPRIQGVEAIARWSIPNTARLHVIYRHARPLPLLLDTSELQQWVTPISRATSSAFRHLLNRA